MANNTEPIEYMLTTVDNPFDPFTQFDEWMEYDTLLGYHTLSFLDRIVNDSSDLSGPNQAFLIQEAIEEIARENVSGMHKKVSKSSFNTSDA